MFGNNVIYYKTYGNNKLQTQMSNETKVKTINNHISNNEKALMP